MRRQTICKALFTFSLCFTFMTGTWAQAPENGTKLSQAEAAPFLLESWDDKAKLKYFSIDMPANTNIQTVFQKGGSDVTHIRMARGKIEDTFYLFTIGVNAEGKPIGDYYISKTPVEMVLGPCPRNCD